ncbi:MAG: amidohydrolase family protein [Eggerthellaceae bacterium]|jgi:5-methylthioadenosine/S-adenosylhomocysteine deaminase
MLLCSRYVLPVSTEPFQDGAILVRGGKILDIGPANMLKLRHPHEEIKDFGNAVLMPGLIDLYSQIDNSVLRGLMPDAPYPEWVLAMLDYSQKMDKNDWYHSSLLGGLEALSSGITTSANITANSAPLEAVEDIGMRSVIYREVRAVDRHRIDDVMKKAEHDIDKWQASSTSGLVTVGIAPGPVFTCHPAVFRAVSELANRKNIPVAMRLAGSQEECNFLCYGSSVFSVSEMQDRNVYMEIAPWLPTGASPVRYALNWDAFEAENVMVIQGIYVNDEDIKKLKEYNVSIATCPRSNAQLGMGVAPVMDYLKAGINVGFGTNSSAATEATDLIVEMRTGMQLQRAMRPADFINSSTVLEMGTLGAARVLKMDDKIGSLEMGKCADIIAIDLSHSHQMPFDDPASSIVNTCSGNDVLMTMVDGEIRYENSQWRVDVNVSECIDRVIELREKLRA